MFNGILFDFEYLNTKIGWEVCKKEIENFKEF